MSSQIQSVRGMNDVLPDEARYWDFFENTLRWWLLSYGYKEIRTPIVESTPLFKRAIGEVTDIVEKEMYSFVDSLNGESLTLRPEGTAGCARAVIEHKLAAQHNLRLWYMGQMFRHERPQKGRYRQFNQVGVETFGFTGPDIDAELILMGARLWSDLGLENIQLQINSLGQPVERAVYREKLIAYFEKNKDKLDEEAQNRMHKNPLRVLDSKNPDMQEVIKNAPILMDFLGEESLNHFNSIRQILDRAELPYVVNPRLVRGLDYYNLTVFEWITDKLGAQGTVCAGGRYDGLVEQLGGKPTPACGFAMGIERLIALIMDSKDLKIPELPQDFYLVHQGDAASAVAPAIAEVLRDHGLRGVLHCGSGNFKAQMKKADNAGALYAFILGEDEVAKGEITIKPLRDNKPQFTVSLVDLPDAIDALFDDDFDENEDDNLDNENFNEKEKN